MSENWHVFQRDVLDVLKQYEPYMDLFERIGSLRDSRPDCSIRISREDKKEIWVVDAKKKPCVDEKDRERMNKYLDIISSNPIDIGLEMSEISDYDFRGIFVTETGNVSTEEFEQLPFSRLHQFLQEELVYTDTDKVVRDVARMMEAKQLSQAQARLLFRSVKPFEERVSTAMERLKELETRFVGLELEKPPISRFGFDLPVDAVMTHSNRDDIFLFDIPYSREAMETNDKVDEIQEQLDHLDGKVYYAVLNTFEPVDEEHVFRPEQVGKEIKETAGILSPDELIDLFSPKIPLEKEFSDDFIEVRDQKGIGYRVRVSTSDDIHHTVEARMPPKAAKNLKEAMMNSREIGEIDRETFRQEIVVTPDLDVRYGGGKESYESYRDAVRGIFRPSVNKVLGKKVSREVN